MLIFLCYIFGDKIQYRDPYNSPTCILDFHQSFQTLDAYNGGTHQSFQILDDLQW
jgi:hypothetical protein